MIGENQRFWAILSCNLPYKSVRSGTGVPWERSKMLGMCSGGISYPETQLVCHRDTVYLVWDETYFVTTGGKILKFLGGWGFTEFSHISNSLGVIPDWKYFFEKKCTVTHLCLAFSHAVPKSTGIYSKCSMKPCEIRYQNPKVSFKRGVYYYSMEFS